jgi:hypothetical protein
LPPEAPGGEWCDEHGAAFVPSDALELADVLRHGGILSSPGKENSSNIVFSVCGDEPNQERGREREESDLDGKK